MFRNKGEKEYIKDWELNSPHFVCHLCQATTETLKRKNVSTSKGKRNMNKSFKNHINSWFNKKKESCETAIVEDGKEYKTFVMICALQNCNVKCEHNGFTHQQSMNAGISKSTKILTH